MDRQGTLQAAPAAAAAGRLLPGSIIETADGTHLHFRDWGAGRPVVFVASWSLPSESWSYQMLPLARRGYRAVAYDRRGHGRSSDPGGGYDFDTLADDLAAVLAALELEDATLVGFSMAGGEIVRYLTRHGSERVAGIVLIGTTTPFLLRTADNPGGIDGSILEAFRREQLLRDYPKWIDDNLVPFVTPDTSPGMMGWIRAMALGASLQALHDCHVAISATDFRAELPGIGVPALLLHGGADATSPIDITARAMEKLMPHAELVVYEGAPHGIPYTHTDRLNQDLLRFLAG